MEKVQISGRDAFDPLYRITPGILRANRQIYHEALPVLYRKNTFSFTSITSLRQFTRDAKPGLELLRHVEIATTGRFALWEPMNQLLRAENLRSLTISIGPDDVKDKGWSDLVLEMADYVRRKAAPARRREALERIHFVSSGVWMASGSELYRSCSSEGAPEQVRSRIERRLVLTGCLPSGEAEEKGRS